MALTKAFIGELLGARNTWLDARGRQMGCDDFGCGEGRFYISQIWLSKKRRRRPRESAQDMTEKVVTVVETIRGDFNYTKDSLGEWLLVKLSPLQFADLHSHEKSFKREEERRNGPV